MADHNDPNAVNHIFSDIDYSPADLYDLFGWPTANGTKVVFALTFASAPAAGVMDADLLYRLLLTSHPRVAWPGPDEVSVESLLRYFDAVKDKYLGELKTAEIRVTVETPSRSLAGFSRIRLKPQETKTVTFRIQRSQLAVWNAEGKWAVEPGQFTVWAGGSSQASLSVQFRLEH